MRKPYTSTSFDMCDLVSLDPIDQFKHWFEEANAAPGYVEANAMSLATATPDGVPSVRMVLLKGFDQSGFVFFTNYKSRKGKELEVNPHCSLMFHWPTIYRSVRIDGKATKMDREKSVTYFHKRPKDSQVAASCAYQSIAVPNKQFLDEKFNEIEEKFVDSDSLPCPEFWGGYCVAPSSIEFWGGHTSRRHDRLRFRRPSPDEVIDPTVTYTANNGWVYERLGP